MLNFTEKTVKCGHENLEHSADSQYGVSPVSKNEATARQILIDIMKFRRFSEAHSVCASSPCEKCLEPHLAKISSAVQNGRPVTLVLPAFPGKSPNLAKVLGTLPDMAEKRALEFLQYLCDRIRQCYSPGARVILCSDGRVFSDVVGMRDENVTAYQLELSRMIEESGFSDISTFDLDDLYEGFGFDQMRAKLMEQFGEPLESFKAAVSRGKALNSTVEDKEAHRLYCGITRFLVEDAMSPDQKKSRTAIQKECRTRAYSVIQRSKAWGEWVEARFPHAVRLSIHPQTCGAKKLGIRLIEPDHWLTPWHAAAVEVGGRYILLKRSHAEELGAKLVHLNGRPSHFVLKDESRLSKLQGVGYDT